MQSQLIGTDEALAQGWTLFRYDVVTADHDAWMAFRQRGAVVVDCQWEDTNERRKRVWTFGMPPEGWTGDLKAIAQAAGMFEDAGAEGFTFRWLRVVR